MRLTGSEGSGDTIGIDYGDGIPSDAPKYRVKSLLSSVAEASGRAKRLRGSDRNRDTAGTNSDLKQSGRRQDTRLI